MIKTKQYDALLGILRRKYRSRLKTVVLFGSQARQEEEAHSDHDIFVIIENLPHDPLARQREIRSSLFHIMEDLPGSISFVAKTPEEVKANLTPLMLDICVDGICLYGHSYFDSFRQKALVALQQSGLKRRRLAGTLMWVFPQMPTAKWDLSWEGYHEQVG